MRFETFPHCGERFAAGAQGSQAERLDLEVALRSSAALRRGIAERRRDVAFVLEPIERSVQRADRQRASRSPLDVEPDRHAVGLVAEAQDGQQDDLFELAEMLAAGHMFCIIELYGGGGKRFLRASTASAARKNSRATSKTPARSIPLHFRATARVLAHLHLKRSRGLVQIGAIEEGRGSRWTSDGTIWASSSSRGPESKTIRKVQSQGVTAYPPPTARSSTDSRRDPAPETRPSAGTPGTKSRPP